MIMKKLFLSGLMAAFLVVGLTSMMAPTPPENAIYCQSDCAVFVAEGIFPTQGACLSACNTCLTPQGGSFEGPGTASGNIQVNHVVCECKILQNDIPGNPTWAQLGINNMGQCIALLRSIHGV
tara:strand:+ start:755 stop:1123 length:369 start_codon:yes stop_codon:yes gene_type:complete